MDIEMRGKKALVTGGTRGIGRAIVEALADAGADVITCYGHDEEAAESLRRRLDKTAGDHLVTRADVSDEAAVRALAEECRERFGGLDLVVNNAGSISHVPFAELPAEEWRRVVDSNLTAAFLVTQAVLPLLGEGGSVINVGSRVATVGIPLRAHYTAAKAGLIGLTRSLAKELGPRGIRVNLIAPGPIETEAEVPAEVRQRYQKMIALGRLGRPEDIARVVLFLGSDLAAFVNGETINVDGGI